MHQLDFIELETINKKTNELSKSYFRAESIEAICPVSEKNSRIIFNDGTLGGTVYCSGKTSDIMQKLDQDEISWEKKGDQTFIKIDRIVLNDLYLFNNNSAFIRYRSIQYFQEYLSYTKLLLDKEIRLCIHTPDGYNDYILINQNAEEFKELLNCLFHNQII